MQHMYNVASYALYMYMYMCNVCVVITIIYGSIHISKTMYVCIRQKPWDFVHISTCVADSTSPSIVSTCVFMFGVTPGHTHMVCGLFEVHSS